MREVAATKQSHSPERRNAVKEYRFTHFQAEHPYEVVETANKWAKEGWRLISVCPDADKDMKCFLLAFFERKIPDTEDAREYFFTDDRGWKYKIKPGGEPVLIKERETPAPPAEQPKTVQLPPGAYFDKSGHH